MRFLRYRQGRRRLAGKPGSEYILQCKIVQYLNDHYPNLLFTASAGGARTSIGTAMKLKMMGCKAGVPDLMIFYPTKKYHSLFIELKTEENRDFGIKKGRVSPEQEKWIDKLNLLGYCARVCYGYENTKETIEKYLTE